MTSKTISKLDASPASDKPKMLVVGNFHDPSISSRVVAHCKEMGMDVEIRPSPSEVSKGVSHTGMVLNELCSYSEMPTFPFPFNVDGNRSSPTCHGCKHKKRRSTEDKRQIRKRIKQARRKNRK